MTREQEILILAADGCTVADAKKHLEKGTIIFDSADFENNFFQYMREWGINEEEQLQYWNMIEKGVPVLDWSIVNIYGIKYYIMYVL